MSDHSNLNRQLIQHYEEKRKRVLQFRDGLLTYNINFIRPNLKEYYLRDCYFIENKLVLISKFRPLYMKVDKEDAKKIKQPWTSQTNYITYEIESIPQLGSKEMQIALEKLRYMNKVEVDWECPICGQLEKKKIVQMYESKRMFIYNYQNHQCKYTKFIHIDYLNIVWVRLLDNNIDLKIVNNFITEKYTRDDLSITAIKSPQISPEKHQLEFQQQELEQLE
ncbi:hypothetical protein pb186bvf_008904 [Paramecium bursaria]